MGNFERAIEDLTRAIELDPRSPLPYVNRGWASSLKGDFEQARRDCESALARDPELSVARSLLGQAMVETGSPEKGAREIARSFAGAYCRWPDKAVKGPVILAEPMFLLFTWPRSN